MNGSPENQLLLGAPVAQKIKEIALEKQKKAGVNPRLLNVIVGENPDAQTYSNWILKTCQKQEIEAHTETLLEKTTTEELLDKLDHWNKDPEIHGVMLQHPFPKQIEEHRIFEALSYPKDVDGVSPLNFGRMALGLPAHVACTPLGMMAMLYYYQIPLEGKEAVVLGRSAILGKPMAQLLLAENATVTICHSRTQNLEEVVSRADLLISAMGKPHFVKGNWIKDGAVVLDAGYSEGKGDVEFEAALSKVSKITPVPKGVGPVTLATLMYQIVQAVAWQKNLNLTFDLKSELNHD